MRTIQTTGHSITRKQEPIEPRDIERWPLEQLRDAISRFGWKEPGDYLFDLERLTLDAKVVNEIDQELKICAEKSQPAGVKSELYAGNQGLIGAAWRADHYNRITEEEEARDKACQLLETAAHSGPTRSAAIAASIEALKLRAENLDTRFYRRSDWTEYLITALEFHQATTIAEGHIFWAEKHGIKTSDEKQRVLYPDWLTYPGPKKLMTLLEEDLRHHDGEDTRRMVPKEESDQESDESDENDEVESERFEDQVRDEPPKKEHVPLKNEEEKEKRKFSMLVDDNEGKDAKLMVIRIKGEKKDEQLDDRRTKVEAEEGKPELRRSKRIKSKAF